MPTYDYECQECGYEFESFHSMFKEPLVDCPKCNEPKLIKLISAGALVIVKGTENPCRGGAGCRTTKQRVKPKRHDRLGEGKNKTDKPFWRDSPVNKKVLKNPEQYIKEGEVG